MVGVEEVRKNMGKYLKLSAIHPVIITSNGYVKSVMVSIRRYDELILAENKKFNLNRCAESVA